MLGGSYVQAAQVVSAEYFIDTDPGAGSGTPMVLTGTNSLATGFEQASVSLSGRSPGTYTIGIRVKDDQGRWSNAAIRRFTLSAGAYELAGRLDPNGGASQGMDGSNASGVVPFAGAANAEYFINTDPGAGSGTPMVLTDTNSLATGFEQASVSLSGRTPGTYTIGIRVKDNQGRWSNAAIRRFTLSAGAYELAGGLDPNGSASQGMDGSSASGVAPFAGAANAEYFIDNDPGAGSGTPMVLTDTNSLATGFEQVSVSLSGRAPGTYTIGIRVKDNQGRWSNAAIRRFTLSAGAYELAGGLDPNGNASQGMDGSNASGVVPFAGAANAEYFINTDPGAGSGTPMVLTDTNSLATGFEQVSVSLSGRYPGTYTIGIRVKDNQGRWSNAAIRRFTLNDSTLIATTEADIAQGTHLSGAEPRFQVWSIRPNKYFSDALYQVVIGGKVIEIQRRPEETIRSFMLRLQQAISNDASLSQTVSAEMSGATTLLITNKHQGVSPESWVTVSEGLILKIEQVGDLGSNGRKIVAAEYFSDVDPGEGMGYPIDLVPSASEHHGEFTSIPVNISAIKSGNHIIGVRFKNAAGRWGAVVFRGYGSFSLFEAPDTTPPVIMLQGSVSPSLPFGQTFVEPGFTASDEVDGSLTTKVVIKGAVNPCIPGIQTITYTVADSSGNVAHVTRQVNVLDDSPPVFTGNSLLAFNAPPSTTDVYRGLGAQDAEIGSLAHRIRMVSGSVNWAVAGSYALEFEVSDTAGNTSRLTRIVTLSTNATKYPTFSSWIMGRSQGLAFTAQELNADSDPDHDGLTNRMEWLSDTDPFDEYSKLEMDFLREPENLVFQWSCNQRIGYWIDHSPDLQNWSVYSQEVNADQGGHFALDVPILDNPQNAFFRLSCKPRLPIMSEDP
jgi:hypothetical protein